MEKHAPSWNGIGYVQVEYEGRTYMSNSITEANIQVYAPRQTRKPNGATI